MDNEPLFRLESPEVESIDEEPLFRLEPTDDKSSSGSDKPKKATARDIETPFDVEELFFSTTDRKGVIQSGNEVFVRLSKYTLEDLLGSPHNIIRHPDMPRAVFKLLWDYLLAGKTIAAYVKNLAADGSYYWVFALVTPLPDGGYLSIRLKPTSEIFSTIKGLYPKLCEIEKESANKGESAKKGMQLSTDALVEALNSLGLESYDEFMHIALQSEMSSRDIMMAERAAKNTCADTAKADMQSSNTSSDRMLVFTLSKMEEAQYKIKKLYEQVDDMLALSSSLNSKASYIKNMSREFRLVSLNTAIIAAALEDKGKGLGTVAANLGESSKTVGTLAESFFNQAQLTTRAMMKTVFHLATARLGIELSERFCHEEISSPTSCNEALMMKFEKQTIEAILSDLSDVLISLLDEVGPSLEVLLTNLRSLKTDSEQLHRTIITLQFILLAGIIESVHTDAQNTVGPLLKQVEKTIETAKSEFETLDDDVRMLFYSLGKTPILLNELGSILAKDISLKAAA